MYRDSKLDFARSIPFLLIHLACFATIWVGISWVAAAVCLFLYVLRMFAITGGYHRYFSHRSYDTSRFFQFLLAFLGTSSAQKGPLWWAAHHRHHHKYSDTEEDIHSPGLHGLYWAHVGWVLSDKYLNADMESVKDLTKYPEIRFLDNWHLIAPVVLGTAVFALGSYLGHFHPSLGTNGWQMLIVGFCLSTVLLYHGTFVINSLCHIIGRRRFKTTDESKNSLWMALITLGEGWHNNHHRYPGSERQGFYWWEIDITHYILTVLSWFGLVWNLRTPPERIYAEARVKATA